MVACDKCITKVLEFKLQSNSELNENNSRSHKKKKNMKEHICVRGSNQSTVPFLKENIL